MPWERSGPVTWAQQEWFADLGEQEDQAARAASNGAARYPGHGVPVATAVTALNDVLTRHEGLRTHITRHPGDQYLQAVCTIDGGLLDVIQTARVGTDAEAALAAAVATPFQIDKQWPVVFVLMTDGDAVTTIGAVIDHSAIDAYGFTVLGADVDTALRARAEGRVPFAGAPAAEAPLDTAATEAGPAGERHLRRAEQFWRRQYVTLRDGLAGWTPKSPPAPGAPVLRSYRLASARTASAAERLTGVRPAALYLLAFATAIAAVEDAEVVAVQALTANRLSPGLMASVRKAVMPAPVVVPRGGTFAERLAATGNQLMEGFRFANFPPARSGALAREILGDLRGTAAAAARFNFIDNSVIPGYLNHTSLGGEGIRFTDPAIQGVVTADPPRPGGSRYILSVQHQPLGALMTLACHEDTAWSAAAPDMLRHIEDLMVWAAAGHPGEPPALG
jgi:hypothetical protein